MSRGRILVVLGGALALLCSETSRCWAQNDSKSQEPKSGDAVNSSEIPIEVLKKIVLGYSVIPMEIKSDLTAEQIQLMKQDWEAASRKTSLLQQTKSALYSSPRRSRRLDEATRQLQLEFDGEVLKQWGDRLSPQQLANIRRRNRQAMQIAKREAQKWVEPDYSVPLDRLLSNDDLLSALERPVIQDLLEMSDEQVLAVEAQQKSAESAAIETIRMSMTLFEQPEPPFLPIEVQKASEMSERLLKETRKILTEEQWNQYESERKDPQRAAKLVKELGFQRARPLLETHGAVERIESKTQNGKTTIEVTLSNAFDDEQTIATLKLTAEQQEQIADLLEKSKPTLIAPVLKAHEARTKFLQDRADKLNDILRVHSDSVNVDLAGLLTEKQLEVLQKERFKGTGTQSLLNPIVIHKLGLSESQSQAIQAALNLPGPKPPEMKPFQPGPDGFQSSAEFHEANRKYSQQYGEHRKKIDSLIYEVLDEKQRQQFAEMTGYLLRAVPNPNGSAPPGIGFPKP